MTEFLKNNPVALQHCFFYEFLQGKSFETIYFKFSQKVGDDAVDNEEFQDWFDKFKEGLFDDNQKPKDNIVGILRNDKQALLICVLYELLAAEKARLENLHLRDKAMPVFARYKQFCKVIGDDVMDYREFDFWFYRFANGEFGLNYERDEDKKTLELTDMPFVVMRNIVEYLDFIDRAPLSKTSRSFHTFVKDQKIFQPKLALVLAHDLVQISFGTRYARTGYTGNRNECIKSTLHDEETIPGVSFWKKGFLDFKRIVENTKLFLDNLTIVCMLYNESDHDDPILDEMISEEFENSFNFTHHLNVKQLEFQGQFWRLPLKILPYLKQNYLQKIDICLSSENPGDGEMKELVGMEQWKQAKYFKMTFSLFDCPLHHSYHFKEFHIRLRDLSVEDIREMKEVLFKLPNFEKCTIGVYNPDIEVIGPEFGDAIGDNKDIYHYQIPNSSDYFEIELKHWNIEITRKKK